MKLRHYLILFLSVHSSALLATETVYTLYRNSMALENIRYHIATFDSADGQDYNEKNCWRAADLFQAQKGVGVRFWCEKGRFKK